MDHAQLGRSGLSVSRHVLGTMNFATETSEQDSHAIMDRNVVFGFGAHSGFDDMPELLRMVQQADQDG
jgi:hypothetical protein